jgi:hypothetical protein
MMYINIPLVNSFDNSIVLEGYLTISDDSKDHWAHICYLLKLYPSYIIA